MSSQPDARSGGASAHGSVRSTTRERVSPEGAGEPGQLLPGSPEAEAASDALLLQARECGLRLAACLRRAASRPVAPERGLLEVAKALELSCAYYTEAQLARKDRMGPVRIERAIISGLDPAPRFQSSAPLWLSGLVAGDLNSLAARVGLTDRQAEVWVAHLRGDTLAEIAARLEMPTSAVYRHLVRAQQKVRDSWLAPYRQSVRACAPVAAARPRVRDGEA